MKKILIVFFVITSLISCKLFVQSEMITQLSQPHPMVEIDEWKIHLGDLKINDVIIENSTIWKTINLNNRSGKKNGIEWFKQDLIIPKEFDGLDVILYINAEPSVIVYLNGEKLLTTKDYYSNSVLSISAKADTKYSIQVKTLEGKYNSHFYSARIVGMPKGYARFISSFPSLQPKEGLVLTDWKFKKNSNDASSQLGLNDSDWEKRKSGEAWKGEMQHAWYRAEVILPKEIDGFAVEGKPIRLIVNTNDKGEIWINGKFKQKFREGDGNVLLSNSASLDSPYLITIKAINEWGVGDIRYANIFTDEAYKLKSDFKELIIRLDRLTAYCERHPNPDMPIINKITEILEINNNFNDAISIAIVNSALNVVETELAKKPAFLILPYLQNLQDDGLTIMWETVYPTSGRVLYGKNGQLNLITTEDEKASTLHEIKLSDLKPNEIYNYKVENLNISSIEKSFKTKPSNDAPFKFVVLGDTRSRHDIHSKIVNSIKEFDPLFVINTGDMVGDGRIRSDWDAFFNINRKLMSSSPYYTVLGNHEQDASHYYDFFDLPNNERYYSFKVGDALFVILDSEGKSISDVSYVVGENSEEFWQRNFMDYFNTQKKWLENVLDENKDAGFVFVFQHKPLFTVMKSRAVAVERYRKIWGDIFERKNVQIIMNGHDHHYHHAKKNGIHYITTAGGGAGLYPIDKPLPETIKLNKIEHFVLIKLNEKEAILNVIDINGNEIDKIILSKRKIN